MSSDRIGSRHILFVEDDPRDVELTLAALDLDRAAIKVTVVDDGAEALDYLYRRGRFRNRVGCQPIVVVLDNKMPKVSGLEVLKTIKGDAGLRDIPVVIFTSSREPSDLREFYRHGANAYVVKPLAFQELTKTVAALGTFWAVANEPPLTTWNERAAIADAEAVRSNNPQT